MPRITIGTYNVNNLFDRFDDPYTSEDDRYYRNQNTSPLPHRQRYYLARILAEAKPEVLALQEIENKRALWEFNEGFLGGYYKNLSLIEANDFRGIDVAVASVSRFPLGRISSHQFAAYRKKSNYALIFSRDLLEIDVLYRYAGIQRRLFTLFVTHLKSKYVNPSLDDDKKEQDSKRSDKKRRLQAEEIVRIIKRRFPDPENSRFIIAGDMNDAPDSPSLKPLMQWEILKNPVQDLPDAANWTYKFAGQTAQFDYLLLSPPVAKWLQPRSVTVYHPVDRDKSDDEVDMEIAGASTASDHYLVMLTLKFDTDDIGPEDTWEVPRWED